MGKIKMIGLDLDGTVFNDNKEISEENKAAIREAAAQGIIVLPATGRPLRGLPKAMLEIEGIHYAVTSNGGAVYDLNSQKAIYEDCIPNEEAKQLVSVLNAVDGLVEVYIDGVCYAQQSRLEHALTYPLSKPFLEYIWKSRERQEDLEAFLTADGGNVQKMHLLFGSTKERQRAFEMIAPYEADLAVTSAMSLNIEINKKSADKGNGLIALGKILGIQKEEIMACGDAGNDLAMMQKVGFAVAMGNAEPEIKAAADYVTLTNEENGVAYAIRKFALNS